MVKQWRGGSSIRTILTIILVGLVVIGSVLFISGLDGKSMSVEYKIHILPVFSQSLPVPTEEILSRIKEKTEKTMREEFEVKLVVKYMPQVSLSYFFTNDMTDQFKMYSSQCKKVGIGYGVNFATLERHIREQIAVKINSKLLVFDQIRRFFVPLPSTIDSLAMASSQRYVLALSEIRALFGGELPKHIFVECWGLVLNSFLPPETDIVLTNTPLTTRVPDAFHPDFYNLGMFTHYLNLVSIYPFLPLHNRNQQKTDIVDAVSLLNVRSVIASTIGLYPSYSDNKVGCLSYVGPEIRSYAERFKKMLQRKCSDDKELGKKFRKKVIEENEAKK